MGHSSPKDLVIKCRLQREVKARIDGYAEELRKRAHTIGDHGLDEQEFRNSGIFHGAIERLRGKQAASMTIKQDFLADVLNHLAEKGKIAAWNFSGSAERHDYEISLPKDHLTICEAKGCLDGNNTNIFIRPPNADEFIIWSLCQNPGSDPGHNAWSGIHTRLGAQIIARKEHVDALVIWDMVCGTAGRPCPKIERHPDRATTLKTGRKVPPPCIYLFPRTTPDARNNPNPKCWNIEDLPFVQTLWSEFRGDASDVIQVEIKVRMLQAEMQRMTTLVQGGRNLTSSRWTTIKRASG